MSKHSYFSSDALRTTVMSLSTVTMVVCLAAMPTSLALWCRSHVARLVPLRLGFEVRWGHCSLPFSFTATLQP